MSSWKVTLSLSLSLWASPRNHANGIPGLALSVTHRHECPSWLTGAQFSISLFSLWYCKKNTAKQYCKRNLPLFLSLVCVLFHLFFSPSFLPKITMKKCENTTQFSVERKLETCKFVSVCEHQLNQRLRAKRTENRRKYRLEAARTVQELCENCEMRTFLDEM